MTNNSKKERFYQGISIDLNSIVPVEVFPLQSLLILKTGLEGFLEFKEKGGPCFFKKDNEEEESVELLKTRFNNSLKDCIKRLDKYMDLNEKKMTKIIDKEREDITSFGGLEWETVLRVWDYYTKVVKSASLSYGTLYAFYDEYLYFIKNNFEYYIQTLEEKQIRNSNIEKKETLKKVKNQMKETLKTFELYTNELYYTDFAKNLLWEKLQKKDNKDFKKKAIKTLKKEKDEKEVNDDVLKKYVFEDFTTIYFLLDGDLLEEYNKDISKAKKKLRLEIIRTLEMLQKHFSFFMFGKDNYKEHIENREELVDNLEIIPLLWN